MDLHEHLIAPLEQGGHGHDPEGYPIAWMDWEDLHIDDHQTEAWWADALTHAHEEG